MIHRQAELPSLNGNPRKQLPSLPAADSASHLESFLGGKLHFHWQPPQAGSLSRMKRNEISMCHVLCKLPLQCVNLSSSPNWTVVVGVKLPLLAFHSHAERSVQSQILTMNTSLFHSTLVVASWHMRGY